MKFDSIQTNNNCNCLEGSIKDIKNTFARKIDFKSKQLKDGDFKPSNKSPETNDCNEICGLKGISIDLWNDSSRIEVLSKYRLSIGIVSGNKKKMAVFRFKTDAGLVKHTPNQKNGIDKHHHDFFRQDDFKTGAHLELVGMKTYDEINEQLNNLKMPSNV